MNSESDSPSTSVAIPKKLFDRIAKRIRNTSFSSVSEYVIYLLEKEMYGAEDEEVFSEEDEEKIMERLRRLGYL